jgi:hypothetical protein
MKNLAEATGGFYRNASNGADLANVYSEIAGDLKNEAAVNTTMTLDYGTFNVNNLLVNGPDVFSYVRDSSTSKTKPGSTWIYKFNKTRDIFPPYTVDDTQNWTNKELTFDVGTIKLNETWETNFRLKALRGGHIQLFGPTSLVNFTDSMNVTNSLTLPNTSVSVSEVATGKTKTTLTVTNLQPTGTISATSNHIPMQWTTTYDGPFNVTEQVSYSYLTPGAHRFPFNQKTGLPNGTTYQTAVLDVSGYPTGDYYIHVIATSPDPATDSADYGPIYIAGTDIYIQLQ